MGCFLACFGSKDGKRRKSSIRRHSGSRRKDGNLQQDRTPQAPSVEIGTDFFKEARHKSEELNLNTKKKVTFDLNAIKYEKEDKDDEIGQVTFLDENEETIHREKEKCANSVKSKLDSFPPNHRYQNCSEIDEEDDFISDDNDNDIDDSDLDDGDDYLEEIEGEESFESYFSLAEEKISATSGFTQDSIESNSLVSSFPEKKSSQDQHVRDRSQYVHSVLNPVENLCQWKALKTKPSTVEIEKKENLGLENQKQIPFSPEPFFKQSKENRINVNQEIMVDSSLSNWLISSEPKPIKKTSMSPDEFDKNNSSTPISSELYKDRPILGALTVEDIQKSASPSPRKSPRKNPDEIPIVGTVGSYWNY